MAEPTSKGRITDGLSAYSGNTSGTKKTSILGTNTTPTETIDLSIFTTVGAMESYQYKTPSASDILSLGKGPLNPDLFTAEGLEQIEEQVLLNQVKNEERQILKNMGLFNDTDIERIVNGEITPEELIIEICEEYEADPTNTDRMLPLAEAAAIKSLYTDEYPYGSVSQIKDRIAELEEAIEDVRAKIRYKTYSYDITAEDFKDPEFIESYLADQKVTAWLGVDKEGTDTKGWTIVKIGTDKYVMMDGQRHYIGLDGNRSNGNFTAAELIAAGYTLTETHAYNPSRANPEDEAELEALKAERDQLNNNLEEIHTEIYGPEPEPTPETHWLVRAAATGGEFVMDIIYGVDKLAENLVDGGAYLIAGGADLIGQHGAATDIRGFIATDYSGDAFDDLMGEGGLLHGMDQASYYHHDDVVGRSMQQGWGNAAKYASYIALIWSGYGVAATGAVGMGTGMGSGAERTYRQYGTQQTTGNAIRITGSTFLGMMDGYFGGQMSQGLITTMRNGVGNTLLQSSRNIINGAKGLRGTVFGTGQSRLLQALNTGVKFTKSAAMNPMTHLTAASVYGQDATNLLANWADTGEINLEDAKKLGGKALTAYSTICATSFLGGVWAQGLRNNRIDNYFAMQKLRSSYKDSIPDSAFGPDGKFIWKGNGPADNGAMPGTRKETTLEAGSQFDRYGGETGTFTSPVENGKSVPVEERVLPYKAEALGLPNNYTVKKEISTKSLNEWFSNLPPAQQLEVAREAAGMKCVTVAGGVDLSTVVGKVESGAMTAEDAMKIISVDLKVNSATIAPHAMFGSGGGIYSQIELPVSVTTLKNAGFVEDLFTELGSTINDVNLLTYYTEGATQ